jgi:transposase
MGKKRIKRKKKRSQDPYGLPVIRTHVGGADLGSRFHTVCIPTGPDRHQTVRSFGTTTPQLKELVDWLRGEEIESLAMESTSVYWIPLYEMLERSGIEAVLANARHVRNVPGCKTDPRDSRWLQLLHSVGLLKGSFRPGPEICQWRALTRQSAKLVEARTRAVQWMQKALDQMNIAVHRAVSDLTGVTGLSIIRAIVAGERDPLVLARFRDKRCKKKEEEIAEHLQGTWYEEHLFNLERALEDFDHYEKQIAQYEVEIQCVIEKIIPDERKKETAPDHPKADKQKAMIRHGEESLRQQLWRFSGVDLTRIDGIRASSAQTIFSEVGLDLSSFPNEDHFVSWLRICPPSHMSAGKRVKKPNSTGSSRLSAVLRMAALSVRHADCALGARYRRIARRKSAKTAVLEVARTIAKLVFRMLCYGQDYVDEGVKAYENRFHQRRLKGLISTAEQMGYVLVPKENAA